MHVYVIAYVWFSLGIEFKFNEKLMGGAALDATGVPLPEETLTAAKQSDAVLLGAIGGWTSFSKLYLILWFWFYSNNLNALYKKKHNWSPILSSKLQITKHILLELEFWTLIFIHEMNWRYKWDKNEKHLKPETGLLQLREGLKVFANLRPASVLPQVSQSWTWRYLNMLIIHSILMHNY